MARTNVFETLAEENQGLVNEVVESVMTQFTTETGETDLDLLMAALEKLNDIKKSIKEEAKTALKEKKEAEKLRLKTLGMKYVETLSEGSEITFRYGDGGGFTATLPISKITDKSVQVIYTDDMLPENYKTNKRSVPFEKIIVPDDFSLQATA